MPSPGVNENSFFKIWITKIVLVSKLSFQEKRSRDLASSNLDEKVGGSRRDAHVNKMIVREARS